MSLSGIPLIGKEKAIPVFFTASKKTTSHRTDIFS
jgi:hypothetical protein